MVKRYSDDLWERAAAAVASGHSCREVASFFGVSVASVVKRSQRQRATGTAAARQMGGHRKRLLEPHRALVIDRVKAVPDITLRTLVGELAEQGITTSTVSVWRLVRSDGLRFKKALFAVEQLRPKIARRREQWKKYQGRLDPRRLVFIDESRT
jgi:transposase